MKIKLKELLIQLIPLFIVFIIMIFVNSEILYTILIILLIIASFLIKYYPGEWKILVLGFLLAIIFEVVFGLISYRLQHWEQDSLFGVPYWLPFLWAYGFVYIRRIGNFLINHKQ